MDWFRIVIDVLGLWTLAIAATYVTVKYLTQRQ